MTHQERISLQIDSHADCVASVSHRINELCRQHGMDEMNSYQVQTAATEAINNAILHAYENRPGHQVDIEWSLVDRQVCIKVSDCGKTMQQIPPDIEPSPQAESGRGWWIMRRWMDSVEYEKADGVNRLIMKRKI